jgi:hypothetical protein
MSRPTVVVGVGAGGTRMLGTVADRVGAGGGQERPGWMGDREVNPDRFRFLAVDTDEGDLRTAAPGIAETITLDPPDANAEREYLAAPPSDTEAGMGLRRRRALARLALESGGNISDIRGALEVAMRDCLALDDTEDGIDVWLLAGLGGGIGGGSLPLLTALAADAAADIPVPVSTYAFGSLPAEGEDATSAVHARNAYVTVRELLALLPDGEADYPIELELPLAEAVLGRAAIRLTEPPLAGLFLASVDREGRTEPVERAAATTLVGHALTDGRPDLAFDNTAFGHEPGPPAFAATAGRVTLPTEGLDRLFDLRSEHRAAEDQLRDLAERIEVLESDIGWLDALLEADLAAGEQPDRIDDPVLHYPQRRVADADTDALASDRIGLDTHIDSVVSEAGRAVPERVPTRAVVALVLGAGLADRLDGELDSHALRSALHEARTEYDEAVEAVLAEQDAEQLPPDPVTAWRTVLEPALSTRAEARAAEAEDRLNPLASRRLSKQAEAAETRAAELRELAAAYETLTEVRAAARERTTEARETLRECREELRSDLEGAERERDGIQETRRELAREREALRERLSTPGVEEGGLLRHVPLTNPVDLIPETLSFADSIAELVSEGFVDETAMATELVGLTEALADTVHEPHEADTDGPAPAEDDADADADEAEAEDVDAEPTRSSRMVMSTARANRWGPAGDLLGLAPDDGPDVQAALAAAFDDRIGVEDGRGFVIDLAGLYAPVSLREIRTLGALHEAFEDTSRGAEEVFGELSDAAIRDAIAYPELLPDDTRGAKQREVADAVADIEIDDGDSSMLDRG